MKTRKLFSLIIALVMTASVFTVCVIPSSAKGGVEVKLNEIMEEFPPVTYEGDPNSVYFTVSGEPSDSYSSQDCYYPDVAKAHGYDWNDMWPAYSCCGFVHFVFRYLFGSEFTWEGVTTQTTLTINSEKETDEIMDELDAFFKSCKPGDALLFKRPTTHYAIFLSYDATEKRALTYDCGWDQECAVKTLNRRLTGMTGYDSITCFRAKNYDEIDNKYESKPVWEYYLVRTETGMCAVIDGYSGNERNLEIPSEIDGYTVFAISAGVFAGTSIESVTIPETITGIGKDAFADTPLFEKQMEDNELYIDDCLIYVGFTQETYSVRPGTVLIADGAFNSYFLEEVTIPRSVKYIGFGAFENTSVKTIRAARNSDAHRYAVENGFDFIPLEPSDEPEIKMLGDVNFDSKITVVDAKWILQSVANTKKLTQEQLAAADVNSDSKITVVDAKWVLQAVAGVRELEQVKEDEPLEDYKKFAGEYCFASGSGAWSTTLNVNEDLSFYGNYHDSEIVETETGSFIAEVTECDFEGRFSAPEKLDDYTYKITMESFETDYEDEYSYYDYDNDIKYVFTSEAYGIDDCREFYIYLPGRTTSDLSDEFTFWYYAFEGTDEFDEIPRMTIRNPIDDYAFIKVKDAYENNEATDVEASEVKAAYMSLLNDSLIPQYGKYNFLYPSKSMLGINTAMTIDLDMDNKDEFVVIYSVRGYDTADFFIRCYSFDVDKASGEITTCFLDEYELFSVYLEEVSDDLRSYFPMNFSVYTKEYENHNYVFCEYVYDADSCMYSCDVFTVEDGDFVKAGNIKNTQLWAGTYWVYSDVLPSNMKIDNSDFAYEEINYEIAEDDGTSVLYCIVHDSPDGWYEWDPWYEYDKYYNSEDEAVRAFFDCFGLVKNSTAIMCESGLGYDNDLPEGVTLVFDCKFVFYDYKFALWGEAYGSEDYNIMYNI